ncbi:hypothetical protein RAH41_14150 [Gottfriedia acidiceleris]|uniref:hypothetical protein n=1 Tax=Gottfriedia acidiceleris TaxID=371036 RepID=UPI002F26CFD1
METIKQNLSYIEKSLLNETHKEQGAIIHLMFTETILRVKETTFIYEVPYSSENYQKHMYSFISISRKATLLTDLEELHAEISKKNTNIKRSLVLVQKMLNNDLYKSEVKEVINK